MKRLFSVCAVGLAAALLMGLCACSGGTGSAAPAPTEAPAQTEAPTPTETPASAPACVSAAYAAEDLPEAYADAPTGYEARLAFTTDAPVTEFAFLALSCTGTDESGEMTFTAEPLYTAEALAPGETLVISMTFGGIVPDRGISYVDTDGSTRYFSLEMSGENGDPLLVPFTL